VFKYKFPVKYCLSLCHFITLSQRRFHPLQRAINSAGKGRIFFSLGKFSTFAF